MLLYKCNQWRQEQQRIFEQLQDSASRAPHADTQDTQNRHKTNAQPLTQLHAHPLFEVRRELVEGVDVRVKVGDQGLLLAVRAVGDGLGLPRVRGLLRVQRVRLDLACEGGGVSGV